MNKTRWSGALGLLSAAAIYTGAAHAAPLTPVLLPDPSTTYDGIPIAFKFDQVYSYSAVLLDQLQTAGQVPAPYASVNYQFSTGTGTIPIIVYTGSNGASNPSPFQGPLDACGQGSCNSFDGTWGIDFNDPSKYVGTVGAVKAEIGSSIPALFFDHNEQEGRQAIPNLRGAGRVAIYSATNVLKAEYFFDTIADGGRNVGASLGEDLNLPDGIDPYVTSCSELTVGQGAANNPPCSLFFDTTTNDTYDLDHNKGSGKPDYFLVADGLDLDNFLDTDKIVIEMHLRDLDPGFEEAGLFGVQKQTILQVSEPSTVASLGFGLLALGGLIWARRRSA
jgi:hypothetical protein